MPSMTTLLLSLGQQRLPAWQGSGPLADHLVGSAAGGGAHAGDVLLSSVGDGLTRDAVRETFVAGEQVIQRTAAVCDAYRCNLSDRLLGAVGSVPAHHTQLRAYAVAGRPVLQVAMYPRPASAHGVRLWCDPALVWIFVDEADSPSVVDALVRLQPSWERVRVHHGPPLDRPQRSDLAARYPVEDPLVPVTAEEMRKLAAAVDMLVGQACVQALVNGEITPRDAVDSTLRARRHLIRHMDRIDKVLEHSHGRAVTKVELLEESLASLLPTIGQDDQEHLVAPHRHLVDGIIETHKQVADAVVGASTTTALMSSAAVGRLLDRSEANRTATTAVAVAAFFIAVLTGWTALAAVPADDRAVRDLLRLGGWVGLGAGLLIVLAYSLARVAALPARSAPPALRAVATQLTVGAAVGAGGCFTLAGITGRPWALAAGAVLTLVALFLRAWTDDY